MANLYARQTALTNIVGRCDYISNPDRQEHLLAVYDGAADLIAGDYWRQLAQECQAASKHATPGTKCVQGRELTIQLSNALLRRMDPDQIAEKLARSFEAEFHRPCMVAIHFNKDMTNLHAHLIYAERELLKEPEEKIAPRALFFDEEGKRRYKKAEILDEAGELRPGCRIVKKGEIYERRCFGSVDQTFSHKGWLRDAKKEWLLPLRNGELKGDIEITEYDPNTGKLAQQHVGKDAPKEIQDRIRKYNRYVRKYNQLIDDGVIYPQIAAGVREAMSHEKKKNDKLPPYVDHMIAFNDKWQAELRRREEEEKANAQKNERDLQTKIQKAKKKQENEFNERRQKQQYYMNEKFRNSRTGRPYQTSLYAADGRRRHTLELIFLLAATVIKNEPILWQQDLPPEKKKGPIYDSPDRKLQTLLDSIHCAREEGIRSPEDLDRRLREAGAAIGRAKTDGEKAAAKAEYRLLKQMGRNLELAQNEQYCYGPGYKQKSKQKESDKGR